LLKIPVLSFYPYLNLRQTLPTGRVGDEKY
jgi:hypothetical protein